jgi:hypothetical protein
MTSIMTRYVRGYLDEYESERAGILAAVDEVFRSGELVLGPASPGPSGSSPTTTAPRTASAWTTAPTRSM